jgi:hypothetical protein
LVGQRQAEYLPKLMGKVKPTRGAVISGPSMNPS